MSTLNIPLFHRRSKKLPKIIPHLLPNLAPWLTLGGSNYPCLEEVSTVPKMFEPLKFDCICSLLRGLEQLILLGWGSPCFLASTDISLMFGRSCVLQIITAGVYSTLAHLRFSFLKFYPGAAELWNTSFANNVHSTLIISSPRDSLKYFEISITRRIRFAKLRKIEQLPFTNEYVIELLKLNLQSNVDGSNPFGTMKICSRQW